MSQGIVSPLRRARNRAVIQMRHTTCVVQTRTTCVRRSLASMVSAPSAQRTHQKSKECVIQRNPSSKRFLLRFHFVVCPLKVCPQVVKNPGPSLRTCRALLPSILGEFGHRFSKSPFHRPSGPECTKIGYTARGLYSRKGVLLPSRCLLERPFLEPLLRTPSKNPSQNPSQNPSSD